MDKKDVLENCGSVEKMNAQLSTDPDIRIITRPCKNMTAEQKKQLRKYAEFMFPEAFEKKHS